MLSSRYLSLGLTLTNEVDDLTLRIDFDDPYIGIGQACFEIAVQLELVSCNLAKQLAELVDGGALLLPQFDTTNNLLAFCHVNRRGRYERDVADDEVGRRHLRKKRTGKEKHGNNQPPHGGPDYIAYAEKFVGRWGNHGRQRPAQAHDRAS